MSEEADLLSVGKHCSVQLCKQLDFLPFQCVHCKETFCLDHRSPASHQCTEVEAKDVKVPLCPVCGQMVKWTREQDLNVQVEKHLLSGCKEFVVKKAKKTNKCSLKSCRKSELIPFVCHICNQRFCVRHRHAQDHLCGFTHVPVVPCY